MKYNQNCRNLKESLYMSGTIENKQKRQTTFWKCQNYGYFVIFNSRILLFKLGLRIYVAFYFKDQRRPSSRLASVMFLVTSCTKVKYCMYCTILLFVYFVIDSSYQKLMQNYIKNTEL